MLDVTLALYCRAIDVMHGMLSELPVSVCCSAFCLLDRSACVKLQALHDSVNCTHNLPQVYLVTATPLPPPFLSPPSFSPRLTICAGRTAMDN